MEAAYVALNYIEEHLDDAVSPLGKIENLPAWATKKLAQSLKNSWKSRMISIFWKTKLDFLFV